MRHRRRTKHQVVTKLQPEGQPHPPSPGQRSPEVLCGGALVRNWTAYSKRSRSDLQRLQAAASTRRAEA